MIKFVMCLTRHPNMFREEFKDSWMNKHGPFLMSNADVMGAVLLEDEGNFIDHSKSFDD